MTMSETVSAAEVADVQPDETVSLHPDSVYDRGDNKDSGHTEQMWDLQNLIEVSVSSMSALQQIELLSDTVRLDFPTTVHAA